MKAMHLGRENDTAQKENRGARNSKYRVHFLSFISYLKLTDWVYLREKQTIQEAADQLQFHDGDEEGARKRKHIHFTVSSSCQRNQTEGTK